MVSPNPSFPELERIPFVGREDILRKIDTVIDSAAGRPTIIVLTGRGGIGKTELEKQVLASYGEAKRRWFVATDVVDVYHPEVRTKTGLVDRIVATMPASASSAFREYRNERNKYDRQLLSESGKGVRAQIAAMREKFQQGLAKLGAKKGILVALDTAEKLVNPHLQPSIDRQVDELWPWLCELLSHMHNIVVLVAGRPQIDALLAAARKHELNCQHLVIPPFSEAESVQYLTALQIRLSNLGKKDEVRRLSSGEPLIRENAHRLTDGDPISLALLADLVASGGHLPSEFYTSPSSATPEEAGLEDSHSLLQKRFVGQLIGLPTMGLTLRALGYLPQGATPELLNSVIDAIDPHSLSSEAASERLSNIAHLAIVKIRQGDQRVFLHDEVYAVLHNLERTQGGTEVDDKVNLANHTHHAEGQLNHGQRQNEINDRVNLAIQTFYEIRVKEAASQFNTASAELETKLKPSTTDFDKVMAANNERRHLLIETLFYRLRQDGNLGFERFYRYMSEAILTGDIVQARELQTTLLEFLAENPKHAIGQLAQETLEVLPLQIDWAEGNYEKAIELAQEKRAGRENVLSVSDAAIDAWDAYARIYLGGEANLDSAKALLDESIRYLDETVSTEIQNLENPEVQTWYTLAVLAVVLRIRGYLLRSGGRLRASLPDYQRAVAILRQLNPEVELATALNDLGFTSAELGLVDEGRALVIEARDLRSALGSRHGVAYSLNTLAMIDVIEGKFDAAIPNAERALAIFRILGNDRGEGLCELTLAEAWRRKSTPESIPDHENAVQNLEIALKHAEEALKKASLTGELLRQTQALVEIGCAHRDKVRTFRDAKVDGQKVADAAEMSEVALREAAKVASQVSARWQIDAWVNLSWLGKYSDNQELIDEGNSQARRVLKDNKLEDYFVNEEKGEPVIDIDQGESWVWAQIGKLHVVLADRAFDSYLVSVPQGIDRDPESKYLEQAILHYAIGLENNQYGREAGSRDLRRVKEQVHARIKRLSHRERRVVSRQLAVFEANFHLGRQNKKNRLEISYMREFLNKLALLQ